MILVALFFGLPLILLLLLIGQPSSTILMPEPTNVTPSEGIPPAYVQVAAGYAAGKVPLQYLAGEVQTESGWDPTVNADATDPNSHAAGLMQFEPETWSGSTDPFMTIAEPDTAAKRIMQYGGYGQDADGIWEPMGTSAEVPLATLEASSRPFMPGYAPYASPYDPFDALKSGTGYLTRLYRETGSWSESSRGYYGGTNWYQYVQTVWQYAYDYLADTTSLTTGTKGKPLYFFLGAIPMRETLQGKVWSLHATVETTAVLKRPKTGYMPPTTYRQTLENEFVTSVPVFAPAAGLAMWRVKKGTVTMTLPLPDRKHLQVIAMQAIPWLWSRRGGVTEVKAGEVVGFVNLVTGIEVTDLASTYPLWRATGTITRIVNGLIIRWPEYDPAVMGFSSTYTVHDPWWPPPA